MTIRTYLHFYRIPFNKIFLTGTKSIQDNVKKLTVCFERRKQEERTESIRKNKNQKTKEESAQ